ncbi:MerR family transcriptional regulator [Kitasatospora sp. NPDC004272]
MRIGELSERTGVSRRLLRYYEEQELLVPERSTNGYRVYDGRCVDRVLQIRGLLDSGLPTRVIRQILPCLTTQVIHISGATPETIATLERERDRLAERIECLTRGHRAISGYLDTARLLQQQPVGTPAAPAAYDLAATA